MSDTINVTVAAPIALAADAAQLARCVGYSADDERTFSGPDWQDAEGRLYRVTSGPVWPAFLDVPNGPLTEPEWGGDMEAAGRALALLIVITAGAEVPPVTPEGIVAVVGMDGQSAVAAMGLSPAPADEAA